MYFERELLERYQHAFALLAEDATAHIGPSFGEKVRAISNMLDSSYKELQEEERRAILSGRGEVATMKKRLGLAKGYGKNLLTLVPEENRLTQRDVYRLIEEFINISQSGLKRGGVYRLSYKTNTFLPDDPDKVKGGIFRVPGSMGKEYPCLSIQMVEKGVLSYLFIILKNETFDPVQLKLLTYVEDEQAWVAHDHFEILSRKTARMAMIGTIKRYGAEVIMPVPLSKVHALIKESLDPMEVQRHRNLHVEFQGYRVSINWIHKDVDVPRYQVRVTDLFVHDGVTGSQTPKDVLWDSLNTAKQFQLFKEVEKKVEEVTA